MMSAFLILQAYNLSEIISLKLDINNIICYSLRFDILNAL